MSRLGKAVPLATMAAAIVLAFGVTMFLTVWYSPDCRSVHHGFVLPAGCGGTR